MIPSLEGWLTKAKEAPSRHEVRLAPLDTNPVFQNLKGNLFKLPPNSGHLSTTDKFFKTRRYPLFRGSIVLMFDKIIIRESECCMDRMDVIFKLTIEIDDVRNLKQSILCIHHFLN